MAYNKAKEEYRWNQWKAEEEKILREQGVDEETIQKLREYDWNDFNAERRFREHQTSLLDCMELLLEEKESGESQPESVEALLDTVENEELLQILLSTDKKTLQMVVRMQQQIRIWYLQYVWQQDWTASRITWNCRSRLFIQDCGGYGRKSKSP